MDKVLPLPEVEAISKATDYLAIGDKAIDYPIHGKTIEDKADNLLRLFNAHKEDFKYQG